MVSMKSKKAKGKSKKYIIGVDFGATFVKLGLLDLNGRIVAKRSFPTKYFKSRNSLISKIVKEADAFIINRRDILGLGIGVPGQVDYKKGTIYNLTNVKGWRMVPLRSILKSRLRMPVYLDNDANVAALGEAEWGAGKGFNDIVCITLGSGLGGGVIIGGEIFRGRGYTAAELGHICIDRNGPPCRCGSFGCLETFLGAEYITKEVVRRLKRGEGSILLRLAGGKYSAITPELITEAAKKGDSFSMRFWRETGANLGIGLVSIVNLLNPEIIIIGGGISKAGGLLFGSAKETLRARALDTFRRDLKVKRARFIADAGLVGTAALVKRNLQK